MPSVELRRRLYRFGHAARLLHGELIQDILLPISIHTWRRRTGGQLKTRTIKVKADPEPLSGPRVFGFARWRKDWVKVPSELAQGRLAWDASTRDVASSFGDAGLTRPRGDVDTSTNK